MDPTPIEEARRALDLAAKAVVEACQPDNSQAARSSLVSVHRFVRTVKANTHLDRTRAECHAEFLRERTRLVDQERQCVRALRELRVEAQTAYPVLIESVNHPDSPTWEDTCSLTRFDALVQCIVESGPDIDDEGGTGASQGRSSEAAEILWSNIREWLPSKGIDSNDGPLTDILERLRPVRDEIKRLQRCRSLLDHVHPGAKWQWLQKVVTDSNPPVASEAWHSSKFSRLEPYRTLFRLLYNRETLENEDLAWLEEFRHDAAANAAAVRSEFEMRLGTRASAAWVLQRYARRCRHLRHNELRGPRDQLSKKRQEREVFLTRDAAVFLFDQGFEVAIEQSDGQFRFDMRTPSLLVEAKVYSARRRPLDAVVSGLKQIHEYVTSLASEVPSPEPILILFRLDGPVASPLEDYTIGNLRVSLVWVNLGSSAGSGSRADPPDKAVTKEAIDARLNAQKAKLPKARSRSKGYQSKSPPGRRTRERSDK